MKHAGFLMFGLLAAGCGTQDIPPPTTVRTHLVPHLSQGEFCTFMMPDGSLIRYSRSEYPAPCARFTTEVVEE